jgi:hypothetical protein
VRVSLFNTAKSHSDSSQRTETKNTNTNTNLQSTSGIAVGGNGGPVTVNALDAGAIGRATDLAQSSIDVGKALGQAAVDLATRTNATLATSQGDALAAVRSSQSDTFTFLNKALSSTLSTNATAFQTVARSQSTNVALSDLTNNIVRYGVIAVGLVVAGVALMAWGRK